MSLLFMFILVVAALALIIAEIKQQRRLRWMSDWVKQNRPDSSGEKQTGQSD